MYNIFLRMPRMFEGMGKIWMWKGSTYTPSLGRNNLDTFGCIVREFSCQAVGLGGFPAIHSAELGLHLDILQMGKRRWQRHTVTLMKVCTVCCPSSTFIS